VNHVFTRLYGDEYPTAVTVNGVRMALSQERRFVRTYSSSDGRQRTDVSRLADGSVSIELDVLRNEWAVWSATDKRDFCTAIGGLHGRAEFADMLRFVMDVGDPEHWSAIALWISHALPREEAFIRLRDHLARLPSHTANITQAIAHTRHGDAEDLLRRHLANLWSNPQLWLDDAFLNWTAFDATCCISHLLELGAPAPAFENQVRELTRHACAGNRDSCATFLHEYYDWIPGRQLPPEISG
jgi:hypothetical protein